MGGDYIKHTFALATSMTMLAWSLLRFGPAYQGVRSTSCFAPLQRVHMNWHGTVANVQCTTALSPDRPLCADSTEWFELQPGGSGLPLHDCVLRLGKQALR